MGDKEHMTYENLIEMVNQECKKKNISVYKLSKLSSVPVSTLYGVLNKNNKAQVDTLCEILKALDYQLVIQPIRPGGEEPFRLSENETEPYGCLSKEKKETLQKLAGWLRE